MQWYSFLWEIGEWGWLTKYGKGKYTWAFECIALYTPRNNRTTCCCYSRQLGSTINAFSAVYILWCWNTLLRLWQFSFFRISEFSELDQTPVFHHAYISCWIWMSICKKETINEMRDACGNYLHRGFRLQLFWLFIQLPT